MFRLATLVAVAAVALAAPARAAPVPLEQHTSPAFDSFTGRPSPSTAA